MHAIMLHRYGPPDVLIPQEVPRPTAGPGQVLIRSEAIGVNFRDTWVRSGAVPPPPGASLPLILGNEVGGTITEVGDDSDPSLIGTRVVAGTGGSGGYAEYALTRADDAIAVPAGIAIAEATALFVQGRVALGAFRAARVTDADRVLILGAAGGVGTLLTHLAAGTGTSCVIGANRTQARASLSEGFGATHTVGYQEDHLSGQLREIAPDGLDVVFDGVGGTVGQIAFEHLATGTGRQVVYGYSSGTSLSVDASALIPRGISVLGFGGQATLPGVQAGLVRESLKLLAKGALRPVIGQRFPLAEANRAHQAVEARETTGKTLLIPGAGEAP